MKRLSFLLVLVAMLLSVSLFAEGDFPKLKWGGRVWIVNNYENNMQDFTDFDEDEMTGNDDMGYIQARVDLNFSAQIVEDVKGVVNFRLEGNDGEKWIYLGKDKTESEDGDSQLADALLKLQEAYVQWNKFCGLEQVNVIFGRKVYNYGNKNIVSDRDKLDGSTVELKFGDIYANLHAFVRERRAEFETVVEDSDQMLLGFNVGSKKAGPGHLNGYFWNLYRNKVSSDDAEETICDGRMVLGARYDNIAVVDGIKPYIEFAMQTGTNEGSSTESDDDKDYAGMMFDIGTTYEVPMGGATIDGEFEVLYTSGNDAEADDEIGTFNGVGLSNREEGWNKVIVSDGGNMMVKFDFGVTPESLEKSRFGMTFWMINDTSSNVQNDEGDDISGGNKCMEFALYHQYAITKGVDWNMGFHYLMPNEDFMPGEDAGMGLYTEIIAKW